MDLSSLYGGGSGGSGSPGGTGGVSSSASNTFSGAMDSPWLPIAALALVVVFALVAIIKR